MAISTDNKTSSPSSHSPPKATSLVIDKNKSDNSALNNSKDKKPNKTITIQYYTEDDCD